MNPENESKRLNPQIREVEIGVRVLRSIKIYPLSMADQLKLSNAITTALKGFFAMGDQSDVAFVVYILEVIKKDMGTILELLTDEEDRNGGPLLDDITNEQMTNIAEIVYEVNYKTLSKKVNDLLKRAPKGSLPPLKRSLRGSSGNTQATDLKTSTEKVGETEE